MDVMVTLTEFAQIVGEQQTRVQAKFDEIRAQFENKRRRPEKRKPKPQADSGKPANYTARRAWK